MSDITDIYQEMILDHSRHPRHFGTLENATNVAEGINPICGDKIKVFIIIKNKNFQNIQFTGHGCALCISSSSIMCELLQNKNLQEVHLLFELFLNMLIEDIPKDKVSKLEKATVFANIKNYPIRIKCTTLAWHTMQAALSNSIVPITTENGI